MGGAGDNAAAAIGVGVIKMEPVLQPLEHPSCLCSLFKPSTDEKGRVHTFCSAVPNEWHLMGVTLAAGSSLQWFRNRFCHEEMAEADQIGVDVYKIMDDKAAEIKKVLTS